MPKKRKKTTKKKRKLRVYKTIAAARDAVDKQGGRNRIGKVTGGYHVYRA